MKKSKGFFKFYILHSGTHTELQIQNSIFHPEDRELFDPESNSTYRRQRDLRSTSIHPTRPSKGIPGIPATRPSKGIPDIPDIPIIHDIQPSRHFYMFQHTPVHSSTFQCFQSSTFQCIQGFTPLQHSPIRMYILHIDWFPQNLHRVPVETLQTFYKLSIFREREMLRYRSKYVSIGCQDDI